MFSTPGTYQIKVTDAYLSEARFAKDDPGAFDVVIEVQTLDGSQSGEWNGECSDRYGVGNAADKQQWEMTLAALEKVGWEHGSNITQETIQAMVGKEFPVVVQEVTSKTGKTFIEVRYLGTFKPARLSPEDAAARAARMFGGRNGAAKPSAPQPPPPSANPFA